jgi:hypothetical protein
MLRRRKGLYEVEDDAVVSAARCLFDRGSIHDWGWGSMGAQDVSPGQVLLRAIVYSFFDVVVDVAGPSSWVDEDGARVE